MKDVRYAFRTLRRSPWYSAMVVCVLGVSMGLATVVFAVVDGVLFKPLPYHRPLELYLVRADVTSVSAAQTTDRTQPPLVSGIEIAAWREAIPELPLTVVGSPFRFKRTGGREYWAAEVDERFFDVMGLRPWLGGFAREDFEWWEPQQGRGIRPLLVSYRYWHQVLGGDPTVIGRTVDEWEREGTRYGERIAGVLPPQFVFPLDPDEPQPEILSPIRVRRPAMEPLYHVFLRVPPGSDPSSARDRLVVATRRAAAAASPAHHSRHVPFDSVRLVPATDQLGRHERPAFALVLSGAAVLLLLACLNVAGLTAARNVERRRDLAVRRALGATAGVLARSLLWEIGLLAIASAAAQRTREMGIRIALGATTTRVVGLLVQEQLSAVAAGLIGGAVISLGSVRLIQSQLYHVRAFDPAVWSAVAVAVVLVSAIGTLIPSMRAARVDPVHALRAA